MKFYSFLALLPIALAALPNVSTASVVPSFATITTSPTQAPSTWYTDRYAPNSFANVGTQFGRNDVLSIGISAADSPSNRPSGQSGGFYDTQGRKFDVLATGVVTASADLYVAAGWNTPSADGYKRSDLWGTLTTGNAAAPVDASFVYPIIGLTNFGGALRFRGWDANNGGWQNLGAAVLLDAWNTLAYEFDASAQTIKYFVNGSLQYTDSNLAQANTTFGAVQQLENVMLQAFNFNSTYDASSPFANPASGYSYNALWSQTPTSAGTVPTPGTLALVALALVVAGSLNRRRR